nr:retrovirus-related Pol polyprotein from transposon TNT 1-94 [Tanacetum cinerariifolium]
MILAIDPDDRNLIAATYPLFDHTFRPIGIEGLDRWDLRQMHMGCWGEGVERIWCRWGVRELHREERGIVGKLGGNICYWLLDTGVKFGLMTQMVLETLIIWQERPLNFESLSFELQCLIILIKLPADPAFAVDFHSCVDINRVLVTKPHNKTPYELLHGRTPSIGFMTPFGCLVTIHNTLDSLGKFNGKVDEGFLVGYSSSGSTNPQNYDGDATFDGKEHDFDVKKHESKVSVSPSSSAQSKKQDDKTKKEAKGKRLEDITYSDDEDDVGVEANFNNLKTSITFKMQKVWVLVDLPHGKRAISTKWVFRNKKDERGIVIMNKARLIVLGHIQEERIDYEEVFTPVARSEAIRLFLAYASFMGFMVYQMDVKSAFLYGTIKEEVYVYQPSGFEDPDHPDKVYKVVKALYGLHQAPRACQDKRVAKILRKFGLTEGKSASTPIDAEKPLLKDPDGEDVDVHTYRVSGARFCIKIENEQELSYETLTRVYLGSYEHFKSVGAVVELLEPGFELQGSKMVEMGQFG